MGNTLVRLRHRGSPLEHERDKNASRTKISLDTEMASLESHVAALEDQIGEFTYKLPPTKF